MKQVRVKAVVATAAIAMTIAACNGGDNTEPAPPPDNETLEDQLSESETDEGAESSTDEGTDATPNDDESATETTTDDESEPSGEDARWVSPDARDENNPGASGDLEILDLRSAPHEYYDRIVLDLEGTELGWSAGFTNEPMQAGSGSDIDMEGSTFLEVALSGFDMPDDDDLLEGNLRVEGENTREVYIDGWFEGQRMIYIGVENPGAYRIFVLDNPYRLVIDIENESN